MGEAGGLNAKERPRRVRRVEADLMLALLTLSPMLAKGRPRPGMNNANEVKEKYLRHRCVEG